MSSRENIYYNLKEIDNNSNPVTYEEIVADIETQNELSKASAAEELAIGQTGYQESLRQREEQLRSNLVGGLMGAGGEYLAGKSQQEAFAGIDFKDPGSIQNWIAGQPDQAKAIDMLTRMAQSQYYQRYGQKDPSVNFEVLRDMNAMQAMDWLDELRMRKPEIYDEFKGVLEQIIGSKPEGGGTARSGRPDFLSYEHRLRGALGN